MGIADFLSQPAVLAVTEPRRLITEPGIYDMPAETYHGDPCPEPSLSAGMINDLLSAPAKCRERSKRLNPDWEEEDGQERFTIGNVSHVIFLEPHLFDEKVVVCDFDDWRKKEAKAQRDDVRADGKTAILSKHMNKVLAARAAFLAHGFTSGAFDGGKFEQSLFWRHPEYGFWCRARPDFISDALTHMNDYKATANADPAQFGKHAFELGYYRRAAWYIEGFVSVFGKMPDHYWFCNQEVKRPYLVSVVELDRQALEDGQAENDYAASIFARCLETGDWYGYRHPDSLDRDRAFRVGLPPYATAKIDERLGRDRKAWPAPARVREEIE